MIHLVTHHEEEGPVSWGGCSYDSSTWNDTLDPDKATCESCLLAAFEYGLRAMRQRIFVKDGRILDLYQSIEMLLEQLAHPVVFVRAADCHDPEVVSRCVKCDPQGAGS